MPSSPLRPAESCNAVRVLDNRTPGLWAEGNVVGWGSREGWRTRGPRGPWGYHWGELFFFFSPFFFWPFPSLRAAYIMIADRIWMSCGGAGVGQLSSQASISHANGFISSTARTCG
ncbi:uncharacterized protein K452DRAFT_29337 [Aplosporella prunicola CBS 121167]|uniref:Uncharacterized protein n=1 Tax=Aplosporella prunicola CBS 121167 TaxID=1176127 RepID=A0A6A6AUT1_9PEZI|nr:uncharacterized protein K452DRAFT_29337 [Aplosporella prunicola CBS 121167]KAF2135356.1 hypothetical protein K452DRAFT_29337 [Aplosporella prunicola CBS 121167]